MRRQSPNPARRTRSRSPPTLPGRGGDLDPPESPQPARTVLERWRLTPVGYLGGRSNEHWLVERGPTRLVLRRYGAHAVGVDYELEVLRRLEVMGWPVATPVDEPAEIDGRTWCLFKWLPGRPPERGPEERRRRGRLLAELHESTLLLTDLGQRRGWSRSDEVVGDEGLVAAVRDYESLFPDDGHALRWHLEQARDWFDLLPLGEADCRVLHGDFSPWNLHYEGERLTGVLDFDATHLNFRVADFALSWRGWQDELLAGYEEVHRLTDLDREVLVPAYWSWLFLGLKDEIRRMTSGKAPPARFPWVIDHLLRRTGRLGRMALAYPGRG